MYIVVTARELFVANAGGQEGIDVAEVTLGLALHLVPFSTAPLNRLRYQGRSKTCRNRPFRGRTRVGPSGPARVRGLEARAVAGCDGGRTGETRRCLQIEDSSPAVAVDALGDDYENCGSVRRLRGRNGDDADAVVRVQYRAQSGRRASLGTRIGQGTGLWAVDILPPSGAGPAGRLSLQAKAARTWCFHYSRGQIFRGALVAGTGRGWASVGDAGAGPIHISDPAPPTCVGSHEEEVPLPGPDPFVVYPMTSVPRQLDFPGVYFLLTPDRGGVKENRSGGSGSPDVLRPPCHRHPLFEPAQGHDKRGPAAAVRCGHDHDVEVVARSVVGAKGQPIDGNRPRDGAVDRGRSPFL